MYSKESLDAMTVIELRKLAREKGVTLSAGISKQGIVDRLAAALAEAVPAPEKPAEAPAAPVRHAAIIADDEDTPVLTPNMPFNRGAAPAPQTAAPAPRSAVNGPSPAPGQPTVNRGNIPGTNKPVFSLEGVRAWHNPRTYQQGGGYNQHGGTYAQQRPVQQGYGQQRLPQRPAPTVSRFGPNASDPQEPVQEPPQYTASAPEARPRREGGTPGLPELLAGGTIEDGNGVLEIQSEGHGYLHIGNYLSGPRDIYVSPAQVRRFHLHTGDETLGKVRPKHENETHDMLLYITEVNGVHAEDIKPLPAFDSLTAVYPTKQIQLSKKARSNTLLRAIDLACPIGFGQRAMIIAPPRCGKTALLTAMANSIHAQYPDVKVLSLMLGERPEDITIARDTLPGEVIYAGFDEPMENHARVAELTLARAKRLAEHKQDVVLLVDSLTSLCRACSECAPQHVRILPGGLAAGSLAAPKRLFGSARALREGGSLTIIAVMLCDTGITLDQVINEEFRGTANMELYLDAAGKIDFVHSLTRNATAMQSSDAQDASEKLRSLAQQQGNEAAAAKLNELMSASTSNTAVIRRLLEV